MGSATTTLRRAVRKTIAIIIVLKTGLDRLVRLIQLGTKSQSGQIKSPKTGQKQEKLVKNLG